jgi:hypothetical protein
MRDQEGEGIADLERIFGVPVMALARHGGSYGPQLVTALGEMGRAYVYSPFSLPGHHATWFANTLNFYGEYGYFDDAYFSDSLFEPAFEELQQQFPDDIAGIDVLNFFGGHPSKVRSIQFWDFNYYYGANPESTEWRTPELRPLESMETARKNFRHMMVWLNERKDIRIVGFRELVERFANQPASMGRATLQEAAERITAERQAVIHDRFSPADIFAALARSISEHERNGALPGEVDRTSPLGPMEIPPEEPGSERVSRDQALTLAREAAEFVATTGSLPAWLTVDGAKIGTGSLLVLFAELFLDLSEGEAAESYEVTPFEAWPKAHEEEIVRRIEGFKDWPVHRTDLDMSRIVEFTKLQLWTLKPAVGR